MFQSNKEYINFLKEFGVHTFLRETPNKHIETNKIKEKFEKKKDLKTLQEINEIADLVPLIINHNNTVKNNAKKIVLYDGNLLSDLMIIGDCNDDVPFGGKSGQLLNKMLSAIKIERNNVYLTNVVPWTLANNQSSSEKEILNFLPFLQRQIEIIKPKVIYLLGSTAAKAILSTPHDLEKLRGKWHQYRTINLDLSIPVLVSYHPAFILKSPNYKKNAWADLQMLKKKINEY